MTSSKLQIWKTSPRGFECNFIKLPNKEDIVQIVCSIECYLVRDVSFAKFMYTIGKGLKNRAECNFSSCNLVRI